MKKVACFLFVFCLFSSVTIAEGIDLSGMTIEELVALQERCQLEIMKSDKWQEVTVPAGVYQIGKEIPAGHWTIKPVDGDTAELYWGTALDGSKAGLDLWNSEFTNSEQITSPTASYAKYNNIESVSWELRDGDYLIIQSSAVVFTPYAGVSFTFK